MGKNPTSCDLVGFFLIFIKKIQLYSKLFTATINDFCIELPPFTVPLYAPYKSS